MLDAWGLITRHARRLCPARTVARCAYGWRPAPLVVCVADTYAPCTSAQVHDASGQCEWVSVDGDGGAAAGRRGGGGVPSTPPSAFAASAMLESLRSAARDESPRSALMHAGTTDFSQRFSASASDTSSSLAAGVSTGAAASRRSGPTSTSSVAAGLVAGASRDPWHCKACTLRNSGTRTMCEACGTDRQS